MNPRAAFFRKVTYLGLIVLLLVPLSLIGMPAKKSDGSGGGVLAELRKDNDISEASLGEIDPTAESVKLVMFGLRAPAITMLYHRKQEQEKRKQWDDQRVTLEELSKLQPHFTGVWRHQAWNLSYNISAEWDDFKQRYRCVKEGIQFLHEGTTKNRREARMIWDMGWFTGQKLGRADEHREFRKLFADRNDDLFDFLDANIPDDKARGVHRGRRDNWLMGKAWYVAGADMIDQGTADLIGMADFQYFSSAPMAQHNYAEALEVDGAFGPAAKGAWEDGSREWTEYGNRPLVSEVDLNVRLNDWEPRMVVFNELVAELDALKPGLRQELVDEKLLKLSQESQEALKTPDEEKTQEQYQLAASAISEIFVNYDEIPPRLPADKLAEGKKVGEKIAALQREIMGIEYFRGVINFDYWRERGRLEIRDDTIEARRLAYAADQAVEQGNLEQAKEYYAGSLAQWKTAFAAHPKMAEDGTVGDEVAQMIRRYQSGVLDKLNEELPQDPLYTQLLDRFMED
ncbi:MAG: hypothetical protein SGJ19_15805 [Planctomycetia bacterium]|nr:hypothetical protein [Planctomycetia bacterium]